MSNFIAPTFHPVTGVIETANWLDDHFGNHHYGVYFPSDGVTYDPLKHDCEQVLPKAAERIAALEDDLQRQEKMELKALRQRDELAAWVKEITDFAPGFVDRDMVDRGKEALAKLNAENN